MENFSRISKYIPVEERFWRQVQKTDTCWLWIASVDTLGYGRIRMNGKRYSAHRFSFFLHYGKWPEPTCLHLCDTPRCVNPDHLRAGTQYENVLDAVAKGRIRHGECHPKARLTTEQVLEIRRLVRNGRSPESLASRYGIAGRNVRKAAYRETWKHLP